MTLVVSATDYAAALGRIAKLEAALDMAGEMASERADYVNGLEPRIAQVEDELARAKNILTNIAESDSNWTVPINNFLSKLTASETASVMQPEMMRACAICHGHHKESDICPETL